MSEVCFNCFLYLYIYINIVVSFKGIAYLFPWRSRKWPSLGIAHFVPFRNFFCPGNVRARAHYIPSYRMMTEPELVTWCSHVMHIYLNDRPCQRCRHNHDYLKIVGCLNSFVESTAPPRPYCHCFPLPAYGETTHDTWRQFYSHKRQSNN